MADRKKYLIHLKYGLGHQQDEQVILEQIKPEISLEAKMTKLKPT